MYWLCGSLAGLDAHLPRPGWKGENLGLPTGQGTLTALGTREGGPEKLGEGERSKGKWREMGDWEEAESFSNIYISGLHVHLHLCEHLNANM